MKKRYALIYDIKFNVNINLTLGYIGYKDDKINLFPKNKLFPGMKKYLHISVAVYYPNSIVNYSIYIPLSKIVKREKRRIIKQKEMYEPSEEFIPILKAAIILFKNKEYGGFRKE